MVINNLSKYFNNNEYNQVIPEDKSSNGSLSLFSLLNICIKIADQNNDGNISEEEFSIFSAKDLNSILSESEVNSNFDFENLDSTTLSVLKQGINNIIAADNEISENTSDLEGMTLDEFVSKSNNENESDFWKLIGSENAEDVFSFIDSDNDGKLSIEELNNIATLDGDNNNISFTDFVNSLGAKESEETVVPANDAPAPSAVSGRISKKRRNISNTSNLKTDTSKNDGPRTKENIDKEIKEQESKKASLQENADLQIKEQEDLIKNTVEESELSQEFKEEYNAENEKYNELITQKDNEIDDANTLYEDYTAEAKSYDTSISKISSQISEINDKKNSLDSSKDSSLIREYSQKIQTLRDKKLEYEKSKSEAENKANEAKQHREELKADKEKLIEEKNNLLTTLSNKYPIEMSAAQNLQSKIQEYQQNIDLIQSNLNSEISKIDDKIQELKNEKTQLIQNEKTEEILSANRIAPDSSPIQFTDNIKNVDWSKYGYDKEAGENLAKAAYEVGSSMTSSHNCLGGVKRSFIQATGSSPMGDPGKGITAAAKSLDVMRNNEDFREIQGISKSDLGKLPAGSVIVWSKSSSGSSPACKYGHISISLGDGRESSDHICKQYRNVGNDGKPYVFIPIA